MCCIADSMDLIFKFYTQKSIWVQNLSQIGETSKFCSFCPFLSTFFIFCTKTSFVKSWAGGFLEPFGARTGTVPYRYGCQGIEYPHIYEHPIEYPAY